MQEHAGKIHGESELGVGTAFQLEFPVAGSRPMNTADAPALRALDADRKTLHV